MLDAIPRFDRRSFRDGCRLTTIGDGAIGGKATGLLRAHALVSRGVAAEFPGFVVDIPTLTVVTTDHFERFLERNSLRDIADREATDERIAQAFQRATFPTEAVGDLRALAELTKTPLAVRSSSLLEDALHRPLAGVYGTKMIPNNQPDADTRFSKLVEAVKFVWASTFFADARSYLRRTERTVHDERMAVIIQEVVGCRHGARYYPDVSGVARSYAYYRSGAARPEDGVVSLALGLGKTIVDGGVVWSYSPARESAGPPFASPRALLAGTQVEFWAVNMGKPPAYDPIRETEYLVRSGLREAEEDGTLSLLASTYDAGSDRLVPGIGRKGPRALTFAPILVHEQLPLNGLVKRLLAVCAAELGEKVEIEFALALSPDGTAPPRFGFLQVRPLAVSEQLVSIAPHEAEGKNVLLASDDVLGNGLEESIEDVVYVRPEGFGPDRTRAAAEEIATLNLELQGAGRPYLLIGFGRWGSSDSSLGIPVRWSEIGGARVIVEATLPTMNVEASQGSHFFHNLESFGISYFCIRHDGNGRLDWDFLARQPAVTETEHVRHVRMRRPLLVEVDGRTGRGVVLVRSDAR